LQQRKLHKKQPKACGSKNITGKRAAIQKVQKKKAAAERAAKKAAEKKATGGVSVRSKSVDTGTQTQQTKDPDSYKIKDLDKLEKGQAARAAKKAKDAAEKAKQLRNMRRMGRVEGATATAGLGTAGLIIVDEKKKKKNK
jgi:hypothetical protein